MRDRPHVVLRRGRANAAFGPLKLTLDENSYSWQFLPVPGLTCANAGTSGTFSGSDNCH
jgi:hypothetical protein